MSSIPELVRSSFRGKIAQIPGVYVDNFESSKHRGVRAYFLSDYHSDHIKGLHSPQLLDVLLKNNITIYTNELTAAIINDERNDERLMKCVRGLKMGMLLFSFILNHIFARNFVHYYDADEPEVPSSNPR